MNLVFEKFAQTMAPNQQVRIGVAGEFMRISKLQFPITVYVVKSDQIIGKMRGFSVGDRVKIDFDALIFENGAYTQDIEAQICSGEAGSDSVLGIVQVINGEQQRVKNGQAFAAQSIQVGSAGNYSQCELWNPAASGKNLIVTSVDVRTNTAGGSVVLGYINAAIGLANATVINKKAGDTSVAVGQLRNGTRPDNPLDPFMVFWIGTANQTLPIKLSEPLIITPGWGLATFTALQNQDLQVGAQWIEEGL